MKKSLATLLAVGLTVAACAGCGGGAKTETSAAPKAETTAEAKAE